MQYNTPILAQSAQNLFVASVVLVEENYTKMIYNMPWFYQILTELQHRITFDHFLTSKLTGSWPIEILSLISEEFALLSTVSTLQDSTQ